MAVHIDRPAGSGELVDPIRNLRSPFAAADEGQFEIEAATPQLFRGM